ncbi:carboxypeptidase regulatory-like domain-containing protein [Granulicella sp. WH15]|uniref:carboxypeptidase-like regulatory domain-containing protein n=1 Tax=Granulicella sp. WH15 TaxID=2602070 RepID=UPI001367691F|nr:carboxypeptidase-like regulatory domain-containing protein [Granulicella sp. WH15]QHN02444.1 carboxypeptidase regulatory-like domain-containing protein [Granulicella sp. WH15]
MMPVAHSVRRLALILALSASLPGLSIVTATPMAAQQRGAVQRVIQGKVEDKDGAPIKGAIVYLRDGRTSSVRSAISDTDGSYRFGQLSLNTDYEIWAALEGKKSDSKSISSFDSKSQFNINLKIDK